jgi:hypothetical protein
MFLRISRNRKGKNVYEYAQICERYRENGKQKSWNIWALSGMRVIWKDTGGPFFSQVRNSP